MNEREKQFLIDYAHLEREALPDEVREALEHSPELAKAWDQSRQVQQLMALKSHELPEPAWAGRNQYKVRTRLENLDSQPLPEEHGGLAGWAWLKLALGVLAVALVGINLLIQIEKNRQPEGNGGLAGVEPGPGLTPPPGLPELAPHLPTPTSTNLLPVVNPRNTGGKIDSGRVLFLDNPNP